MFEKLTGQDLKTLALIGAGIGLAAGAIMFLNNDRTRSAITGHILEKQGVPKGDLRQGVPFGNKGIGLLDINSASADEFEALPGIGPKIAKRIIEYRNKAGKFNSVDELQNVRGIGAKKLGKIKPYFADQKK